MEPIDCEDIYNDGEHYDLQNRNFTEDIPFYLKQIKKYGEPVLEIACGTGRITIPVAEQGIQITGLDISEPMLAFAKKKAASKDVHIEWVREDCRNFNLDKKFALILLPFNSIAHLHSLESIESCFSSVKEHLKDSGRFIIDIFNPRLDILLRDPSKRYPVTEYPDPDGRGTVTVTENNIYNSATQINRIKWYFHTEKEKEESVKELNMRIFFPQELDALLHYNGFEIETKFGNYDETPFKTSSPIQLVISRPK